jgi:Patched family
MGLHLRRTHHLYRFHLPDHFFYWLVLTFLVAIGGNWALASHLQFACSSILILLDAAILVLDEERIKARRMDCCICFVVPYDDPIDKASVQLEVEDTQGGASVPKVARSRTRFMTEDDDSDSCAVRPPQQSVSSQYYYDNSVDVASSIKLHIHWSARFMDWYADQLLRPCVKILVLIGFSLFLAGCIYSATKLKQDFKASDFLPSDSYALGYLNGLTDYTAQTFRVPAYFRNVDQSDPEIQQQMQKYIDDLVNLPQFQKAPEACWFRDFKRVADGEIEAYEDYQKLFHNNWTFAERLEVLMSIPEVMEVYGADIDLDENGNIEVSRCWLSVLNVDLTIVKQQVNALSDMYEVTRNQAINQGLEDDEWAFFPFDSIFFIWDFFTVVAPELVFNTYSGIIAVSLVGFVLIPHWTASLFVTPLIIVLYIELLGKLHGAA